MTSLPDPLHTLTSGRARFTGDLPLPAGTLHAYKDEQREAIDEATGNPFLPLVTGVALWAQGPPIYGGTDQVQRNIIGERVLGLPKEPSNERTTPWRDLPRNG